MSGEVAVGNNQSGLGMIEILVALLILSIGLLGLAAMQITSTKMTGLSQQKTQARILAEDMVERVRANLSNPGDYDDVGVDSSDSCAKDFTPPGSNVANNDAAEWTNSVRCLLANGQGDVDVDTGNRQVIITMEWDARMDASDDGFVEDQNKLTVEGGY